MPCNSENQSYREKVSSQELLDNIDIYFFQYLHLVPLYNRVVTRHIISSFHDLNVPAKI